VYACMNVRRPVYGASESFLNGTSVYERPYFVFLEVLFVLQTV